MIDHQHIEGLRTFSPNVAVMPECGINYIYIPDLSVRTNQGCHVVDALLCPQAHPTGYVTRLFLSKALPGCGQSNNWGAFRILEREWHSWSWQNVPATLTPVQILAAHLRALQ